MNGEVIPFPVQNSNQESKGQSDTHFESGTEAADAVIEEVVRTRSWFEKRYPHLFMGPGEVITFLGEERREVANVLELEKTG